MSVLPCKFTAPTPARLANSSDADKVKDPDPPSTTADVFASAFPPRKFTEPSFTVSEPPKVFAPESVRSAKPSFVMPNAPLITPPSTVGLATVATTFAFKLAAPPSVKVPVATASPNLNVPVSASALATVRAAVESLESVPPRNTKDPEPSAVLLPKRIAPAPRFTPPVKLLAPVSVNTELPFFTSEPPVPYSEPAYVVETLLVPKVNA